MSDLSLTAQSALGGYSQDFGQVELRELTGKSIVSLAIPNKGEKAFEKALKKHFKAKVPDIGSTTSLGKNNGHLLAMQPGQYFALFDEVGSYPVNYVSEKLSDTAYYSDQSDSWTTLVMTGPDIRAALERICMLDLDRETFPVNRVARTVMEHIGTVIFHYEQDKFILMAPRSSAGSFLHALTVSVGNLPIVENDKRISQ